jgi:ATP-dependent Lon protease
LAAHRGGIKLALIPEENIKDLTDIPDNVKNAIEIVPVRWIDKVLELALEKMPQALPELSAEEIAKAAEASKSAQASSGDVLKH